MMLWLVLSVLPVCVVLVLCTPLEEFVVLDLLVYDRLSKSPRRSWPDLRPLTTGYWAGIELCRAW